LQCNSLTHETKNPAFIHTAKRIVLVRVGCLCVCWQVFFIMNGFEQIKSFYSWVFNNPDKIRPTHVSLYLFLWNQDNRANWAEWIKCPYDLAMQGACIGNKGTYYRCLDDLKSFGLIEYKKGINNYKAPIVKLIQLYDNEQVTEQVSVPQSEQVTEPLTVPQTVPLPVHIYKLITNNIQQITNNYTVFENFVLELDNHNPKTKPRRKPYSEFIAPTIEEVKAYFELSGYCNAEKAFNHYDVANWIDAQGHPVKSWKQKMQTVWFTDANKLSAQKKLNRPDLDPQHPLNTHNFDCR